MNDMHAKTGMARGRSVRLCDSRLSLKWNPASEGIARVCMVHGAGANTRSWLLDQLRYLWTKTRRELFDHHVGRRRHPPLHHPPHQWPCLRSTLSRHWDFRETLRDTLSRNDITISRGSIIRIDTRAVTSRRRRYPSISTTSIRHGRC